MISKALKDFAHIQALAGLWSVVALVLALAAQYIAPGVFEVLAAPLAISSKSWSLAHPMVLWINEAGAALIFLLAGLELKRGFMDDELTGPDRLRLPALGAVGGLVVPLAIHVALNWANPTLARGWIAPLGSDMALGLGVLALSGDRAPAGLKLFFLTTCLFMNVGALILAGGVQAAYLSLAALGGVGICLVLLVFMNLVRVSAFSLYALVGVVLWTLLAASGPASALAGLFLALAIPMQDRERSVLEGIEHDLHRVVGLVLMPALVFVNAGTMGQEFTLLSPWALGVAVGLFVGKQLGVFGLCWLGTTAGLCSLPPGIGWRELHGAAVLCGIGGGASLFWSVLGGAPLAAETRTAVLAASGLSVFVGHVLLRHVLGQRRNKVLPRV